MLRPIRALVAAGAFAAAFIPGSQAKAAPTATLVLDAASAARRIMYVRKPVPVSPGPLTLVYPKWIPGEHGPTGPLNDLAALRISANGVPLDWRRDQVDLYAFHVDVPAGVREIDVAFDVLMNAPGDYMSTHSLAIVNWNRALLYQDNVDSHQFFIKPSIVLPPGWQYG